MGVQGLRFWLGFWVKVKPLRFRRPKVAGGLWNSGFGIRLLG